MKALTLHQPYAWATMQPGGKNIENRSTLWKYRGALAVHAGREWNGRGYIEVAGILGHSILGHSIRFPGPTSAHGAIIGVVDLVDAHREVDGCCKWWGHVGTVHLVLANPRPLPEPIPCRGNQGLWTPPEDVLAQLQEFVGGAA